MDSSAQGSLYPGCKYEAEAPPNLIPTATLTNITQDFPTMEYLQLELS